jgi:preprotein translocase SecE subunit
MAYRKDQGRMARMAAFWSLAVLLFYGCTSLNGELTARWTSSLGQPLMAGFDRVPVLGIQLTGAFLIATVLFAGGMFALYRWLERPKSADLLIETEQELRKVTWPSGNEVVNSSIVVIVCVMFLMGYLAFADWFLARVTRVLLFGG